MNFNFTSEKLLFQLSAPRAQLLLLPLDSLTETKY